MRRWSSLLVLLVPLAILSAVGRCQSPGAPSPSATATNTAIRPSSSRWTVVLPGGAALHPADPERMRVAFDSLLEAIQVQTGPGYSASDLGQAFASFARVEVELDGSTSVPTPAGPVLATRAAVVHSGNDTVVLLQNAALTWLPFSVLDPDGNLVRALAEAVLSETGVRLMQSEATAVPSRTSTASPLFIKITDPAAGTKLKGSVTIRGRAGAIFENQFHVELLDAGGVKLAEAVATVSASATGGSGTFEAVLYWVTPAKAGQATIWAYERSAKDGSIAVQDKLPVWLEGD
jgi:hypothetical protein